MLVVLPIAYVNRIITPSYPLAIQYARNHLVVEPFPGCVCIHRLRSLRDATMVACGELGVA